MGTTHRYSNQNPLGKIKTIKTIVSYLHEFIFSSVKIICEKVFKFILVSLKFHSPSKGFLVILSKSSDIIIQLVYFMLILKPKIPYKLKQIQCPSYYNSLKIVLLENQV